MMGTETMVDVYGDISGDESSPVMAAGCYLGRESNWRKAVAAWNSALSDAGVAYFHATDFYSCHGEFAGWKPNDSRHLEVAKRFTSIATDAGLIGFSFGMLCDAFKTELMPVLRTEQRRCTLAHPRTFVALRCVSQVARFLGRANHHTSERVRVVFEAEEGDGRYLDFFAECQERREAFTRFFDSFATENKRAVPLQIADLLAHEAWRRLKEHLTPTGRPMRKSLERMIVGEHIEVEALGYPEAKMNAEVFRNWLKIRPDGLIRAEDRHSA